MNEEEPVSRKIMLLQEQFPESLKMKRHPLSGYGVDDLFSLVKDFMGSYSYQVNQIRRGEMGPDDFVKQILLVEGRPGHGKTRTRKIIRKMLTTWPGSELSLPLDVSEHPLKEINWETEGELRARDAGFINTEIDKPYSDSELEACNDCYEMSLDEAIEDNATLAILAEAPVDTAIYLKDLLVGRNLGTSAFKRLAHGEGRFSKYRTDGQLRYAVWAVGVGAGPNLRFLMPSFREWSRKAGVKGNFLEGLKLAMLFNQEIPETIDDVIEAGRGASLEQLEQIDKQVDKAIRFLESNGVKLNIPDFDIYEKLLDPGLYRFAPSLVINSRIQRATFALLEYSLISKDNLGLPSWRVLVGDNNPSIEELGLSDEKLDHLYLYFATRGMTEGFTL